MEKLQKGFLQNYLTKDLIDSLRTDTTTCPSLHLQCLLDNKCHHPLSHRHPYSPPLLNYCLQQSGPIITYISQTLRPWFLGRQTDALIQCGDIAHSSMSHAAQGF